MSKYNVPKNKPVVESTPATLKVAVPKGPQGYSRGGGIISLSRQYPADKFIQFRFHDYKSCSLPEVCFCRQSQDDRILLDKFFEESFCVEVEDFKKTWHSKGENGETSKIFRDPEHKDRGKIPIEHIRLNGSYRIHGYYTGNIFHIVSFDPNHEVHKSKGR